MTSFEIARLTNKEHFNVMRDIDKMFYSLKIDAFKFQGIFQDKSNRSQKCYKLDKELTLTLVSGYSTQLRQAIIRKWQELEGEQKPRTYEVVMREALLLADQKVQEQQKQIEQLEEKIYEDQPKVSFATAVAGSATAVNIGDWIKTVQSELDRPMARTKAFQWLRDEGYLMQNNMPYQHFVDQKIFEVKEVIILTPKGDKITFTTLVTGKGQLYLLDKLRSKNII